MRRDAPALSIGSSPGSQLEGGVKVRGGGRGNREASEPPKTGPLRAAPIVLARALPCGCCVAITCPHCGREHTHGAGGGDGHRAAHCLGRSAANPGYVLRVTA